MKTKDIQIVLEEVIKQASKQARLNKVSIHLKGTLTHVHRKEMEEINVAYIDEDDRLEFDVMVTPW